MMATGDGKTDSTCRSDHLPLSHQEDDGKNEFVQVSSTRSATVGDVRELELAIHVKLAELQTLLQQHDRSMKQMLKSHQNSIKQSVKAQLERSQADQRKYLDDMLQKQDIVLRKFTKGFGPEENPQRSES
jgi:hypothetical protein